EVRHRREAERGAREGARELQGAVAPAHRGGEDLLQHVEDARDRLQRGREADVRRAELRGEPGHRNGVVHDAEDVPADVEAELLLEAIDLDLPALEGIDGELDVSIVELALPGRDVHQRLELGPGVEGHRAARELERARGQRELLADVEGPGQRREEARGLQHAVGVRDPRRDVAHEVGVAGVDLEPREEKALRVVGEEERVVRERVGLVQQVSVVARKTALMRWIDDRLKADPGLARDVEEILTEMRVEQRLVALRERRKLAQRQVAELLGTSQPYVAKLEAGRVKNLGLGTLVRYARALAPPCPFRSGRTRPLCVGAPGPGRRDSSSAGKRAITVPLGEG